MRSSASTTFLVLCLLHTISKHPLTAHEPGNAFHWSGCSYVTRYCNSCIADELDRAQHSSLVVVDCSAKNLTEFPTDLPKTTGKLVLSRNMISSLNPEEMRRILYLKELLVDENNISFISERTFLNNVMMESLDLGGNRVVDVIPGIFSGLENLLKLFINRNRISRIKNGTFKRLILLNTLDLSENGIFVIEKGAFSGLKHLTYLGLANNKLRKVLDFNFRKLASLQTLKLEFNMINEVEDESFSDLIHLKSLSIHHNNLTAAPKGLNILGALVFLDLSNNLVEFIPMETFVHLKSLEFLNLSFSDIRVFHGSLLKKILPNLRLVVHHNPLDCTCDLRWLKEWFDNIPHLNMTLHDRSHVTCEHPNTLYGKTLKSLKITDMNCSCEYCQKSSVCASSGKRCKCNLEWAGSSCSDTCQSNVRTNDFSSEFMCSSSQGKCFCSNMSKVCANNAFLAYQNHSLPDCVCKPGYHGDGFLNCTDVDECANAHNPCHKYADCINTRGSFRCFCRAGYQKGGVLCHSIKHRKIVAIAITVVSVLMFIVLVITLVFCAVPKRRQRAEEASRSPRSGGKKKKKQSTRRYVDLYKIRELSFTNTIFRQGNLRNPGSNL